MLFLAEVGFGKAPLFADLAFGDDFAIDFGGDFLHHANIRGGRHWQHAESHRAEYYKTANHNYSSFYQHCGIGVPRLQQFQTAGQKAQNIRRAVQSLQG